MTILNTIPITELTFFALLVIGIGALCFTIAAGGAAANNSTIATIGAVLFTVDFIFALVACLVFKVPFEVPTGRNKYEVTIEDIEADVIMKLLNSAVISIQLKNYLKMNCRCLRKQIIITLNIPYF